MKGIRHRNKKAITILFVFLSIGVVLRPGAAYSAADKPVEVYVNGEALAFGDAPPIIQSGRTLVPFRTIFEALGYTVTWDDGGHVARGEKDGFVIELPIDSPIANVGGVETPLDVPARIVGGRTLIPLRFVSEHSGYDVTYLSMPKIFKIGIADEPDVTPIPLLPEPWFIVGRVLNESGEAGVGIPVRAGSVLPAAGQQTSVTDAQGYYVIALPEAETEWVVDRTYEVEYNGRSFGGRLLPEATESVIASLGGVQNMTSLTITGSLHIELEQTSGFGGQELSPEHIVLTLSPLAPLLDGKEGETIVKRISFLEDGDIGIAKLPIGQYEITAHYMPPGSEPVPVSLRVNGAGTFGDAIQPSFREREREGYLIEIEVKAAPAAAIP